MGPSSEAYLLPRAAIKSICWPLNFQFELIIMMIGRRAPIGMPITIRVSFVLVGRRSIENQSPIEKLPAGICTCNQMDL